MISVTGGRDGDPETINNQFTFLHPRICVDQAI